MIASKLINALFTVSVAGNPVITVNDQRGNGRPVVGRGGRFARERRQESRHQAGRRQNMNTENWPSLGRQGNQNTG